MKKSLLQSIGLVLCSLIFLNCSKGDEQTGFEKFELLLEEEVEDQNIPALSALIFKGDQIIYEKLIGSSNLQNNIALESNHLFLLASISKVVTATALMQLYEDSLFDLDDNINNHLPFNVVNPTDSTNITFRMLLTHTSSIADGSALDGQYYYGQDSPIALKDFLQNYLNVNGNLYNASENFHSFAPGARAEYSNTGNALIGLLVEEISGIDFDDYCKQNIFTPLNMNNTSWRLDEITSTIVQPYNYANNQHEALDHYTFTNYPNGGLRSTARDMSIFLGAFTTNGTVNNHQLLKSSTIAEMLTIQFPNLDNTMGLHLFKMSNEHNLWGHDGGEQGVSTVMAFNPTSQIGVILLSNESEADLDNILIEAYKFGLTL